MRKCGLGGGADQTSTAGEGPAPVRPTDGTRGCSSFSWSAKKEAMSQSMRGHRMLAGELGPHPVSSRRLQRL